MGREEEESERECSGRRNRGMREKNRRMHESKERERKEERANRGDVSHAREHMLGGGVLRRRSALERTGQDGPRGNENDGTERKWDRWMDGWIDGRTDG